MPLSVAGTCRPLSDGCELLDCAPAPHVVGLLSAEVVRAPGLSSSHVHLSEGRLTARLVRVLLLALHCVTAASARTTRHRRRWRWATTCCGCG